jgi:AraC-like DNA-binding protein
MKLYIKNMVCNRCKTQIAEDLDKLGIQYTSVDYGEVNTKKDIAPLQRKQIKTALQKSGFELIDEQKNEMIDKLKLAIQDLENYSDEDLKTSFMDFISLSVNENYISLNTLFSEIEGVTIEKYIIRHKINRIKELLVYDDLSLGDIARKMHYSSVAKLSIQFKRITGLTPSYFRQLRHNKTINPLLN